MTVHLMTTDTEGQHAGTRCGALGQDPYAYSLPHVSCNDCRLLTATTGEKIMSAARGLFDCPCCYGSGAVPSASGMTDVPCLCADLSAEDRVILRGRADTMREWSRQAGGMPFGDGRARLRRQIDDLRSTMVHLVAGCSGPCRGNSSRTPRCNL